MVLNPLAIFSSVFFKLQSTLLEKYTLKSMHSSLFFPFPQHYTLLCIVIVQILLEITAAVCGYKRLEKSKSCL